MCDAEAEIATISTHPKIQAHMVKTFDVLKKIAEGKGEHPPQERPESQLLNSLEWFGMEATQILSSMNTQSSQRIKYLTRQFGRNVTNEEPKPDDNWDSTFAMTIGPRDTELISTDTADKIWQKDEALIQAWAEMQNRINANVQLMRFPLSLL